MAFAVLIFSEGFGFFLREKIPAHKIPGRWLHQSRSRGRKRRTLCVNPTNSLKMFKVWIENILVISNVADTVHQFQSETELLTGKHFFSIPLGNNELHNHR